MEKLAIIFHGLMNPSVVLAQADVDDWVEQWSTREICGGHQALQGASAHQWIARVTLEGKEISFSSRATDTEVSYTPRLSSLCPARPQLSTLAIEKRLIISVNQWENKD